MDSLASSFCHCTVTVLLGSSKGMAASKASTFGSVSTAGNKRKAMGTNAKKAESETGNEEDVDIEDLRSNVVLQVEAELFLLKMMFVGLV